jgi:hypothetical protein
LYFIPEKTSKKGNICVTFNTPEAKKYLINYLKKRPNLTKDSHLFSAWDHHMSEYTIIDIFRRINDNSFFGNNEGKRFFHGYTLRKFFISTCNHNNSDLTKVNIYRDTLADQMFMILVMK